MQSKGKSVSSLKYTEVKRMWGCKGADDIINVTIIATKSYIPGGELTFVYAGLPAGSYLSSSFIISRRWKLVSSACTLSTLSTHKHLISRLCGLSDTCMMNPNVLVSNLTLMTQSQSTRRCAGPLQMCDTNVGNKECPRNAEKHSCCNS